MLDLKSKQLTSRENNLRRREQALTREKLEAARDLEAVFQKKLGETEKRFAKETQVFSKKLNQVERSLLDRIKQAKSSATANLQASTSKQSSKDGVDVTKQLKSRVSNLEKAYEVLKAKHALSETERQRLADENGRLVEELTKLKSAKTRLSKEVQDLKASHATLQSDVKKAMVLDDLEKSQATETAALIGKSSQLKQSEPAEPEKGVS